MKNFRILAINPGSTSTKIAVYENENPLLVKSIDHPNDELNQFEQISDQFEFRKKSILKTLMQENIALNTIDVIVGRGGLIYPLKSGVYRVNQAMKKDLTDSPFGSHASNLGGLIAADIASELQNVEAYIADPVVVDEMNDVARVTGLPQFKRRSIFHALNQKAVSRHYAAEVGCCYEDLNIIVAHLGGGVSIGAHDHGRVIDVNNALDGEGPFSPERAGNLPIGDLVNMCFDGKYSRAQIKKMIKGEGGFVALLGSNNTKDAVDNANNGDEFAKNILNAFSYNIGKTIGSMAAVLKGKVDVIILTGGVAHAKMVTDYITGMVDFIAPVKIYPGEDEMKALAINGLMVLQGRLQPQNYLSGSIE